MSLGGELVGYSGKLDGQENKGCHGYQRLNLPTWELEGCQKTENCSQLYSINVMLHVGDHSLKYV